MGKCLIIKGADFSGVALTNISDIVKLTNAPELGVISSGSGEINTSNHYYCFTREYYQGFYSITVPLGYVVTVRLYNESGEYQGTGGFVGMASGKLDLTQFAGYAKMRFIFSVPANIGASPTVLLTDTDLQNIFAGVVLE